MEQRPLRIALPAQPAETRTSLEGAVRYASPTGNRLQASLNRVMLRFVAQPVFHLRDALVAPVDARRKHMQAASAVLSRAMTQGRAQVEQRVQESRARSRAYASLLGDGKGPPRKNGPMMPCT